MEDYTKYLLKELRDSNVVEYDGFLKNLHPTLTFFVECAIEANTTVFKTILVEILPLSEKMVMCHNCVPVLENELDFEILKIHLQKPSSKS